METEEQLRRWVDGDPVHDDERGVCTPDFSCCRGKEKMAPENERRRFFDAHKAGNHELMDGMLMMFLTKALQDELPDQDIHVAGFHYDP